jgi:squalene-associated FAD-dependent desaturase
MSRPQVAIVGGGLAGMSAALAIRERATNIDITLFESRRITGGRAGSFIEAKTGEKIDYCQHVAMGCCTNLIKMLQLAQLEDAFTRHRDLWFYHPLHAPAHFAKSRLLPVPLHLLPSLIGLPYLSWAQKIEIGRATSTLIRSSAAGLRDMTAKQWLTTHGQSDRTIEDYWEVVIASALGESCKQVSMAAARKVFVDGFIGSRDASDVLIPNAPLATLFGTDLPNAVASRNVNVRTGTLIRKLTNTSDGMMQLDFENQSARFDHVILAVPWFVIAKVLDSSASLAAGLPVDPFANVPCSPITGIHLWFDRPVLDRPSAVLVGTLAQWAFRRDATGPSMQSEGPREHYVQIVISASHGLRQLDHDQLTNQVVDELRHAFPQSPPAQLIRSRVVTDPQSVFSLRPEVDAVRPQAKTALPCLHLAGDFVQTGWPATMEGAVISGRMAASSLLEQLGYRAVEIDPGLPQPWLARRFIRPATLA